MRHRRIQLPHRFALAASAPLLAHAVPSAASIPLLRAHVPPLRHAPDGVALTFDDGPDPVSTPLMLDELGRLGISATFFLLGNRLAGASALVARILDEGHEVGLHGWSHRPHLLRSPVAAARDVRRGHDALMSVGGTGVRFWRPPHGIPSGASWVAAHRLGMRAALWSADGRDWRARETPELVVRRIAPKLRPGAVVLLHDSDAYSASGSWRTTLASLPALHSECANRQLKLGRLVDVVGNSRRHR